MNLSQLLISSILVFTPVTIVDIPLQPVIRPVVETSSASTTLKTFDTEITRLAQKYGKSEKVARAVIKCEGQMYKARGNNINYDKLGNAWSKDIGWWQINDYWHEASAMDLGLDIHNEFDNLEYGFILWSEQGLKPWSASQYCWQPLISS